MMSSPSVITPMSLPLITRRTRAYFAPVNRITSTPVLFDPAVNSKWSMTAPPAPWIDLGWVTAFARKSESKIGEVDAGLPATIRTQVRQTLGATVSFRFQTWTKLTMALASGSQHMNVLLPASTPSPLVASGGRAAPAMPVGPNSTSSVLYLTTSATTPVAAGSLLVLDVDYISQTGFVGAGVSAGYVQSPASVGNQPDVIRRLSFNVARVIAVQGDGGLRLATPLIAGIPTAAMKAQLVVGFVDREGGSFFQEWSALFVCEGVLGDRLFFHYPRLQASQSSAESFSALAPSINTVLQDATFRALPIADANDGEQILCYRSYIPPSASYI